MAKASSGLTSVRQTWNDLFYPPNSYLFGDIIFLSTIRDGRGHAEIHIGVKNNTAFKVRVMQAWISAGPYGVSRSFDSTADPLSGLQTVDVIVPIFKRFVFIEVNAPAPGLGADFEAGAYFLPIGGSSDSSLGGGGGGVVPDTAVLTDSESQDLSAGSLTLLTAFNQAHRPSSVFLHFTDGAGAELALPSDQTLVIKHKSAHGAAFDTEVVRMTLAAGTTNYAFYFPARALHALGDEIEVTLTNTGTPAVTVRASIRAEA